MYQIEYSKSALKTLRRMPKNTSAVVRKKIESIAIDPFAPNNNTAKLQDRDGYRLRIGDWRVIYDVYRNRLVVHVLDIGSRGGIYQ